MQDHSRHAGLDVMRGVLLFGMLAVHVISAYGAPAAVNALHEGFGVFLISSGFVALAGFLGSRRPASFSATLEEAGRLLLVMLTYGVLVSLARHALALASGPPAACSALRGWSAPVRFDDLGILLPIAIVKLHAPLASRRPALALLALGWGLLGVTPAPSSGVFAVLHGVVNGRTLTPFYTVSTFVALGVASMAAGPRAATWLARPRARWARLAAAASALGLAAPPVSRGVLDPLFAISGVLGAAATLAYWLLVLAAFTLGFTGSGAAPGGLAAKVGAVGRHSLPVFVTHALLIELDRFAQHLLGLDKGPATIAMFLAVDAAALIALALLLERRPSARRLADALLLGKARLGWLAAGPARAAGGLCLVTTLAVYTSAQLADSAARGIILDDFESEGCPVWWTFGALRYDRAPLAEAEGPGHVLAVRGAAPGAFAHGRGLYLDQDVSAATKLLVDVRGYGPGSGRLKIELCDDDNGNWHIEKDERFVPLYDDRLVLEQPIDFWGWRQLALPLETFRDDNPGRGNDVFDPSRDLTSGGLLELQVLVSPSTRQSDLVRFDLDNLRVAP